MRYGPLILLALLLACATHRAQANGPFTDARLDALLLRMKGMGTDSNLYHIDQLLRHVGTDGDARMLYFLHRYRCEQLYYQGLFQESMIDGARAQRIAERLHDSLLIASSLNQVSVLYEEKGDSRTAIELLRQALRWYPAHDSTNYPLAHRYRITNNLGQCWANLGVRDSARLYMQRSFELAEEAGSTRGQALALFELGRLCARWNAPDSALVLLERTRTVAEDAGIVDVALQARTEIADALYQTGEVMQALSTIRATKRFVQAHPNIAHRSVVTFHKRTARLLASTGLYSEALLAARTWRTLDSALRVEEAHTARETLRSITATDAALAVERAERSLALAENQAEEHLLTRVILGGMLVLALLIGAILLYISRSRQQDLITAMEIQRAEQQERVTELRVRKQVSEDLHDDLGAGLSALKLQCELAVDLDPEPTHRRHNMEQATLAGDLVGSMRHILWSLNHQQATVQELVHYTTDRARAFAEEQQVPVQINAEGPWPEIITDAGSRRNAWSIIREALHVFARSERKHTIDLELMWNAGLVIHVRATHTGDAQHAAALTQAMVQHRSRVLALGGSLHIASDGHLRLQAFLPEPSEPPATSNERSAAKTPLLPTLLLVLLTCGTYHSATAQDQALYRHPLMDSVMHNVKGTKSTDADLQVIDHAIATAHATADARLKSQLLMSRAKQLYFRGLFDMGIANVTQALSLAEGLDDSLLIATAQNMIGLLHENLGDPTTTLAWFRKAERSLPRDTRSNYPVVKDYHIEGNIAQCLFDLGQHDSAGYYFQRSLAHADGVNDRAAALARLGLGRIQLVRNDARGAIPFFDTATAEALRDGSKDVALDIVPEHARAIAMLSDRSAAVDLLQQTIQRAVDDTSIAPARRRNFLRNASVLLEEFGHEREAVSALFQWQRLDSLIRTTDDRSALATLKTLLDNEQRLELDRAERARRARELQFARQDRHATLLILAALALVLVAGAVVHAGRRRNKRLIAKLELRRSIADKELAELQARQAVSEEMHEDLGAGLTLLKLQSEMAQLSESDERRRGRLQQRAALAGELMDSMRQIIWALDTGRSTLAETIAYIASYATTYTGEQGLALHMNTTSDWPLLDLTTEERRNLFLVVKEALHNTVKHAGATNVHLTMQWRNGMVIELADDGRGFPDTSMRSEGNGLANMRRRMEAVGGTFRSESNGGARIQLFLPLSTAANISAA